MAFIIPFFSGFLAAIVGIFPPGLINMTAAKVSVTDGRRRALVFVFGALIVIFIQTYISVLFAQYINKNIEIVILLREIGLAIFTLLSLYFLFFAKEPKPILNKNKIQLKSKRSRFFMGMLISAINFFPIPYYVLVSVTLASYNFFTFNNLSIYSLVTGVVIGSFSVFYCYVVFFEKLKSKTDYFIRNMNSIIGIITGIVAIITLLNVLDYYL
jgi:threonine/homoserine/homoserine lactone efflux protein